MTRRMKRFVLLVCAVALHSTLMVRAQDTTNPRAKEDLDAFMKKVEEGDTLFNQKKYAEAATPLAAAHDLYQRALRRDSSAGYTRFTIEPQTFPALRYYGYISGAEGSLKGEMADPITETVAVIHNAANTMWQDASILSGAAQIPIAANSDAPMEELTEEKLDSMLDTLYGPVRRLELPVADREWRDVVLSLRRAQLITEYALQKYPAWRRKNLNWIDQPTGNAVLADINKKLAEAEPEYQKLVGDFRKAEPAGVAAAISEDVAALDNAIAGVKRNGWLDWFMARDLYLDQDYLTKRREGYLHRYTADGKTMPSDRLKPIEDKIAELTSVINETAPRWQFPAGKPHDAAIEARVASAVRTSFSGATVIRTALDGTDWRIEKNELGLPRYRARDVLVLVRMPGQKLPWLILGPYEQDYAGGGTYNTGGVFNRYSQVRIQAAQ